MATNREEIRRTLSQIEDFVSQATETGKAAEDRLYGLVQETLVGGLVRAGVGEGSLIGKDIIIMRGSLVW